MNGMLLYVSSLAESIAIVWVAITFSKGEVRLTNVLPMGIFLGFAAILLRTLPVSFGVHTVVYIALLALSLMLTGGSLIGSILAAVATVIVVVVGETISGVVIMKGLNVSREVIIGKPVLRSLVALPHILFLVVLGYFGNRTPRWR